MIKRRKAHHAEAQDLLLFFRHIPFYRWLTSDKTIAGLETRFHSKSLNIQQDTTRPFGLFHDY